jgi:hypothetical protein
MADIDVKCSNASGANELPLPSPSTASSSTLPDAPMRVNDVKPLPTTSKAYRAIADLNRGLEQDRRNLEALREFNFFPEENLIAWGNMLYRLQAEASLRLLDTIHNRLMNNALYYDRLCWTREKRLEDPNDVLLKAEERKREIAQELQCQKQEPEEYV